MASRAFKAFVAVALCAPLGPEPRRPSIAIDNVVFLVIDTLRPDHLGCYGYERPTSPNLDRFASTAVRFERASAAWPSTSQSMAAMLSGTFCQTSGVVIDTPQPIPAGLELLPETLQRAGFRTAAFVANDVLARKYGFDQGFDHYVHLFDPGASLNVARDMRAWLAAEPRRRFFLWLHFIEPHAPYAPSDPQRFVGDAWYDPSRRVEVRTPERLFHAIGGIPGYASIEGRDELDYYVAQYDSEIFDVDLRVGRVLSVLRDLRLDARTLVVVASDHGEGFGEHDYYSHGLVPFEENARIVLMMRHPRFAPGVAEDVVSNVDVAPTVLDLVGLPPAEAHEGRSLRPQLEDPARPAGRPVFIEAGFDRAAWKRSVRDRRFKLVHVPSPRERHDLDLQEWSLYDLDADPRELEDVRERHPEAFARLRAELDAWMRSEPAYGAAGAVGHSPEELERLRALGYAQDGDR